MNKAIAVATSLVGIAAAAVSFVMVSELSRSCIEGPLGTCPQPYITDQKAYLEFSGLKPVYNWKQPIDFAIIAHKFSGCSQINLMIFDELKSQPPLYEAQFVTDCTTDSKIAPQDYLFRVSVISLNVTERSDFVVRASYYQDRASYGEIEQGLQIIMLPVIEETMYRTHPILPTFSEVMDAGSRGLFTVSGQIQGAKISEMSYDEYRNQIQINLAESRGGNLMITVPQGMFSADDLRFAGFIVLIDMGETAHNIEVSGTSHTMNITFPENTEEILIIGTHYLS